MLSLSTINAFAQWTSNIAINTPVVTAIKNQFEPIAISDGRSGVIIVWEDQRNSGSQTQRDIFVQRFDSLGFAQWGDSNGLPIAVLPVSERYYDICSDEKGGAFIVWEEYSSNFVQSRIRAQRVNINGDKMWGDSGIYITNEGNKQLRPKITGDNNGGFFIAYESSELVSSEVELKANRIDSLGNKHWGNGVFFCTAETNQSDLVVTTSADDMLIVTWRDFRNIYTESDIYIQKLSPSGTPLWQTDGIQVCNERFSQEYQEVFPDNSGGAFISWCDMRDSIQFDIFAQRINSEGTFVAATNGVVVCSSPTSQYRPRFTSDMKGGVIVTWNDFRNGPSAPFNIDIYAQRLDSLCNNLWQANGIQVTGAPLSQNNQRIISDGEYGAVITWDDRRTGTTSYDIYAQRIDSLGEKLWDVNDVAISTASGNQYSPFIAPVSGGYAIAFEDTRNGYSDYNIYIQKILQSGSVILNVENTGTLVEEYRLSQNYPNPFNPITVIKFEIPEPGIISIKVFDLTGREISEPVYGFFNRGEYSFIFDGTNLTSGVYLYQLQSGTHLISKKMILIK